jgi:hypothetical protein
LRTSIAPSAFTAGWAGGWLPTSPSITVSGSSELLVSRQPNQVRYLETFVNFLEKLALTACDEFDDSEQYAAGARRLEQLLGTWHELMGAEVDISGRKQFIDRKLRSLALVSYRLTEFGMELDRPSRPPSKDKLLYEVILPVAKDLAERCLYDLDEYSASFRAQPSQTVVNACRNARAVCTTISSMRK